MLGNVVCASDGWVSKGKAGVSVKAAKDISIRGLHMFKLKAKPGPYPRSSDSIRLDPTQPDQQC